MIPPMPHVRPTTTMSMTTGEAAGGEADAGGAARRRRGEAGAAVADGAVVCECYVCLLLRTGQSVDRICSLSFLIVTAALSTCVHSPLK